VTVSSWNDIVILFQSCVLVSTLHCFTNIISLSLLLIIFHSPACFFRRMYKYHFVSECFDIDSIVDDMDRKFFKVLFSPVHCLHSLLPPIKSNPYGLRSRDHNFQLPVCNSRGVRDSISTVYAWTPSLLLYVVFSI